ncbi:MAG: PAS domain-containing protein [Candidatus Neomarinimicrobiota bacterium]
MDSPLQLIEVLATNLVTLKSKKGLDGKCQHILDTLRKTGWQKVSLSFINSKYETKKTLYSGYSPTFIKEHGDLSKLPSNKRREMLSGIVERWRTGIFYYLPWRDADSRLIVSDGLSTEIPMNLREQWHENDLLYAPIFYESRPIAVLTIDSPKDKSVPDKVSLRVPTILHTLLQEVIEQFISQEYFSNYHLFEQKIVEKGTLGIVRIDHVGKITDINLAGEQILKLDHHKIVDNNFYRIFDNDFVRQISPAMTLATDTLEITTVIANYKEITGKSSELEIYFFPQHVLWNYVGMTVVFKYPEAVEVYKIYSESLVNINAINCAIVGNMETIQRNVIQTLCENYGLVYPRIYRLSNDGAILECIFVSGFEEESPDFFNHPYNRNSLASCAIIDDEITYTTTDDKQIRDIRRIWMRLNTQGAVAIPLHVNDDENFCLVCDMESIPFVLDLTKEILFKFIANVISMTLKPNY